MACSRADKAADGPTETQTSWPFYYVQQSKEMKYISATTSFTEPDAFRGNAAVDLGPFVDLKCL
jgi:hypothetical protein